MRWGAFAASLAFGFAAYLAASWQLALAFNTVLAPPPPPEIHVVQMRREELRVFPAPGEQVAVQAAVASWYGPGFIGRPTASGETFTADEMTAAHRDWPLGTWVELYNPANGRRIAVRINDRGPYVDGRDLDLSRAAAEALGIIDQGVSRLEARILVWGDQRADAR